MPSVTKTQRKRGSRNHQSSGYERYFQTFVFQVMDSDYSELKEAQKSCLEDQQVQQIEELYQERTNLEKATSSLVNQVHRHAPDI